MFFPSMCRKANIKSHKKMFLVKTVVTLPTVYCRFNFEMEKKKRKKKKT